VEVSGNFEVASGNAAADAFVLGFAGFSATLVFAVDKKLS
jgi:hypothetical protein